MADSPAFDGTVVAPGADEPAVPNPGEADQQIEARQARDAVARPPRQAQTPKPEPATRQPAVEENPYERHARGPQDDGPELLERSRLNMVNSYYKGTVAGALGLSAMAKVYSEPDPEGTTPEMKQARQGIRDQYDSIVADLIAYDVMPTWSGLPQLGAAVLGGIAGSIPSPESFAGWAAKGATWAARTMRSGLQQGIITGATDPIVQALNINAEVQHEPDPMQTVGAFAFGAVLGAGFHAAGEGVGHLIGQRALRKQLFDLSWFDPELAATDHALWALDPRNGIEARPAMRETFAPQQEAPPPRYDAGPEHGFEDAVSAEKDRLSASYGAAQPKAAELNATARMSAFEKEVGEDAAGLLDHYGLDRQTAHDLYEHYERAPGQHPKEALENAIEKWADVREREAMASLETDSEWVRDMAELERHFESGEGSARGTGEFQADFRKGNTVMLPGGQRSDLTPRPEQEIPFGGHEGGAETRGGGADEQGSLAAPGEGGPASAGREGAAAGGGRERERASSEGLGAEQRRGSGETRTEAGGGEVAGRILPKELPEGFSLTNDAGMWKVTREGEEALYSVGRTKEEAFEHFWQGHPELAPGEPKTAADAYARFDEATGNRGQDNDAVHALMPSREGTLMPGEVRRDADVGIARPADFSASQVVALRSLQQQAQALADAVGVPLRQGRIQLEGAQGQYATKTGVVRVKEIADFEVVKHEVGHAIEQKVGPDLTALTTRHTAELGPLDYDTTRAAVNEGFAEWMRVRMQNPAAAARLAPTFSNAFDAMMALKRPDLLKILNDTAMAHRAWLEAPSLDAVAAVVQNTIPDPMGIRAVAKEIKEEGLLPVTNTFLQKGYQGLVDRYAPLERAVRDLAKLKQAQQGGGLVDIKASEDPSILIRSSRRVGQSAHVQLMFGIVPYRETTPVGPSFKDVLNEALGAPFLGRWDDAAVKRFDEYLAARMSAYLWERYDAGLIPNAPSPIKPGDARQAILEMEKTFPAFRTAADKLQEFNNNIRKKKLDSGVWTKDTYDATGEYDFYVPMKRVFEDRPAGGGGAADGSSLASAAKRRKGSERDIDSPLRNIMMDLYHTEQDIRKNEIGRSLLALSESVKGEGGAYAERLPAMEARKYVAPLEEMMKAKAKEMGVAPDEVKSMIETLRGDTEGELTGEFWKMEQAAARGEPIIFVWEGGKPVPVRVMSQKAGGPHGVFEIMTETPQPILDIWTNMISIGAAALRGGIVNAPTFIVTNYIKDQLQVALSRPGYVPFLGGLSGIWSEITEGRTAQMRAYAGGVMGGSLVGEIERKFEADIRDMAKQGYLIQRVTSLKGALELMQITEAGTRNSVFDATYQSKLKQGLSPYEAMWEAAHAADDIMDFSRNGDRMNVIRKMVPFLNANIQGQDRYTFRTLVEPFYRRAKEGLITTRDSEEFNRAVYSWMMAGGGGIAFGMAWAAMNWEKEVYKDASPEVKGTHLLIPIQDGKVLVMPKPFELGIGFTFGEYAFAGLIEKDPRWGKDFGEAVSQAMGLPNPIKNMPLVSPYIELMTNTSFYRNRPIVPDSVRNPTNPELEYTEKTSSGAKEIGKVLGISPMKIDYAMGALFGTNGRDLLSATSLADKDSPTAALDDVMFVRRFIKDGERVSGRVRQFWDLMSAKNGKYNNDAEGYRKLVKEAVLRGQDPTDATTLLNKLPAAERAYVVMREGANSRGQPAFTPDERRLHPLVRAHDAVTVLNGIARDLQDNTLIPYREKERLMLSPDQRRRLIDEVRTLAGAEMRNGFAIVGEPGYQGRPVYDVNDFMDTIRKVSPNVADEIATRYATNKVYSTQAVQEAWPQIRDEVVSYGTDANIRGPAAQARAQGFEFGGHKAKKPAVIRQPIQGAPAMAAP